MQAGNESTKVPTRNHSGSLSNRFSGNTVDVRVLNKYQRTPSVFISMRFSLHLVVDPASCRAHRSWWYPVSHDP